RTEQIRKKRALKSRIRMDLSLQDDAAAILDAGTTGFGNGGQPPPCFGRLAMDLLLALDPKWDWLPHRGSPGSIPRKEGRVVAAAPVEQTFWETFCDLIGLEPELHDDEKSSTATKARVAAIIATEKFHGVPRWSLGIISCRCTYLEIGTKPREGQDHVAIG